MSPFSLPVRRPVATAMFFLAIFLFGAIAWYRIPVELMPPVAGNELFIQFSRPGSEPAVVEREMLLPLEALSSRLDQLAIKSRLRFTDPVKALRSFSLRPSSRPR